MSLEELEKEDNTFSESSFKAKVDNTFIMLLSAIMTNNLERVKHKISENLFNHYQEILKNLNNNNETQIYDELNVWSTEIESIEKTTDKYIIRVILKSRYMDYKIDKKTGNYKSGINDKRIVKTNYLTFEKKFNTKKEGFAKKCSGCGANIDINNNGKCSYCGSIYNTSDYDWLLVNIETM